MPTGETNELDFGLTMRGAAKEQKLFGRYTLKRVLGRGGMGIVWLAHDDELNRYVAMKFLPDMLVRDREAVEDLKRETRRSLDLTHHHIVRIYDFTQDEMVAAIIMEYVDGETLSAMKTQQQGGCFGVSVLAPWVAHFTSALDYAHRQARVVHRDLKPANLMVNSRGDLKITDFGISRSMSDSMTRVSVSNTAGTLAYMSPEQALGAPPAPHDDIYALGATIYDLLTGRPPFFRGNLQVQLETVIPPKMSDRRTELGNSGEPIPELWEQVVAICLSKRPQDRPQSVGEVAAMLGLSGAAAHFRPGTSSGSPTASSLGTAVTRVQPGEDTASDTNYAPNTPGPGQPGTNRAIGPIPRPTQLGDILGAPTAEAGPAPIVRIPASPTAALAPTIPAEEVTLGAEDVPGQEPPAIQAKPATAPALSSAATPGAEVDLSSTPGAKADTTPVSAPHGERRPGPSKGLAMAALGSVALLAGAAVWTMSRQGTTQTKAPEVTATPVATPVVAKTEPVAPQITPLPKPTYETELAQVRQLIADERLDQATESLAKLPNDLPAQTELQGAIATKRTEMAERTRMQEEKIKREQMAQLLKQSQKAYEDKDWDGARVPLQQLAKLDPENAETKTRLADIDKAQADAEAEAKRIADMKAEADARAKEKEIEEQKERERQQRIAEEKREKASASSKSKGKTAGTSKPSRNDKPSDDDKPSGRPTKTADNSQRPPPPAPPVKPPKGTSGPPKPNSSSNTFRGSGAPGG